MLLRRFDRLSAALGRRLTEHHGRLARARRVASTLDLLERRRASVLVPKIPPAYRLANRSRVRSVDGIRIPRHGLRLGERPHQIPSDRAVELVGRLDVL